MLITQVQFNNNSIFTTSLLPLKAFYLPTSIMWMRQVFRLPIQKILLDYSKRYYLLSLYWQFKKSGVYDLCEDC